MLLLFLKSQEIRWQARWFATNPCHSPAFVMSPFDDIFSEGEAKVDKTSPKKPQSPKKVSQTTPPPPPPASATKGCQPLVSVDARKKKRLADAQTQHGQTQDLLLRCNRMLAAATDNFSKVMPQEQGRFIDSVRDLHTLTMRVATSFDSARDAIQLQALVSKDLLVSLSQQQQHVERLIERLPATPAAAAAPSSAGAATGSNWIAPDLAITDANRARILEALRVLTADPCSSLLTSHLANVQSAVTSKDDLTVAQLDQRIEQMISSKTIPGGRNRMWEPDTVRRIRQTWRALITDVAASIGRDAVVGAPDSLEPAFSKVPVTAAASSPSPAAAAAASSPSVTAAGGVSGLSRAASLSSAPVTAAAAASSSSPPSIAADRVERLLSVLSGGSLNADVALVLQHSRQHSLMQRRIAELESAHASLCATLEAVKKEKRDTYEAFVKSDQLKRKRDRELDAEREKLRATESQLKQQTGDLAAHRAQLSSVAEQLAKRRREVATLEAEQATLLSRVQDREDTAEACLATVKIEKNESEEALAQTTHLKRKVEEELDEVSKRARTTEEALEQKMEQLEQLNCISCMRFRATVAYLPCVHIVHCEGCDRAYQGGPNQAAAAGLRTCPTCRGDIESTGKAYVGQ